MARAFLVLAVLTWVTLTPALAQDPVLGGEVVSRDCVGEIRNEDPSDKKSPTTCASCCKQHLLEDKLPVIQRCWRECSAVFAGPMPVAVQKPALPSKKKTGGAISIPNYQARPGKRTLTPPDPKIEISGDSGSASEP